MFAALLLAVTAAADPLHVPEPTIDAGEVRVGPPLVRRFVFTAGEPLTITEVRSSCGCLVPTLTKRVYQPGERGELTVEVNTLSQPVGSHRWAFHLAYRCGDRAAEQTLELTATLRQEIEVVPAAIAFRGSDPPPAVVTVTDRRPKPLRITGIGASSPHLQAEIVSTGVRVSVAHDCPEGQHAETIALTTDDPDYPTIKLPVTVFREPKRRVTWTPTRATLVAGGSALVQLRAADGSAIQVEAIDVSVPALTCRWAAGPGDRTTVRIGIDRSKWDGQPFNGEVRVRCKAPAGESIVIPVAVRADD
jgi:hypothetical protein